jgi:ATP/maltotriose-dependent transcriptional regulator MalT
MAMLDVQDGVDSGAELLERAPAVATVGLALDALRAGSGSALFVVAAAGMGKTSVLEVARRTATSAGFKVASAVGSRMEMGVPFGMVGQAIVALGGSELEDPADLERLGGQPARLYRMYRWLTGVASKSPVLLALDDLHWADPDSLELVGFLCRRLAGSRVLVMACLRPEPDPAWALARELVGSGHARIVSLAALSDSASRALLERALSRELDAGQSDRVVRSCAGTPLLLKTAAASLMAGGSLPARTPSDGFGWSLLLDRFAGLDGDTFNLVRAAATLGVRFQPEVAAALAGLDQLAWQAAFGRLLRAGLLDDLGSGWARFVHPLFAQALLESQAPSERERDHARAFRLLAERGAPDGVVAEHAHAARLAGDPLAVEITARAGREALAQGALDVAVTHLDNAVELAGYAASDELLLEYASALAARARHEEAERVCDRLLERVDLPDAVRAQALVQRARIAMLAGLPAESERRCEEAAACANRVDAATEAAVLTGATLACNMTSPLPWTLGKIARALSIIPCDAAARRPLEFLGALASLQGGDPGGEELLVTEARAWSIRPEQTDADFAWTIAVPTIGAMELLEDLEGATEIFERQFARATEDGAPVMMTVLAIAYSDCLCRMGRPAEALELVRRTVSLTDWPMPVWCDVGQAVPLTDLGRDEEARPHVEALRRVIRGVPAEYYAAVSLWLSVLDARRLLRVGEREAASETMLHAADLARMTGWCHPLIVPWAQLGLEAHLAAGEYVRARDLIDDLDQLSRPLGCRWPRAVVALGRAQLSAAEGENDQTDLLFERALSLFAEIPMPASHAEALIAYGSHLRRSGRPRLARDPLARALALCEPGALERVARIARAELAAAGGRRRRRDDDPAELTPQERRVAELAAHGMTNAQIGSALGLSAKTIGHYLERIYAKLGISSRRELGASRSRPGSP